MRLFKLCGSVVPVALVLAIFGPSAAMAESTALCTTDTQGAACPEGEQALKVHYDGDIEVLTPEMSYKCDALFLGATSGLGAPLEVEGNFDYTNCDQVCSREEISGGTTLKILKTGEETAEVVAIGTEILVNCSSIISCVWSLNGITGTMEGPLAAGSDGRITWESAPLEKVSGLMCPTLAELHAEFEPLTRLYVGS